VELALVDVVPRVCPSVICEPHGRISAAAHLEVICVMHPNDYLSRELLDGWQRVASVLAAIRLTRGRIGLAGRRCELVDDRRAHQIGRQQSLAQNEVVKLLLIELSAQRLLDFLA
jgi:hypothetical protein